MYRWLAAAYLAKDPVCEFEIVWFARENIAESSFAKIFLELKLRCVLLKDTVT